MGPQGSQQDLIGSSGAGAQVAASNQTLNAWMGGRQPSWMTAQQPTAKPMPPTTRRGHHAVQAPAASQPRRRGRPRKQPQDTTRLDQGGSSARLAQHPDGSQEKSATLSDPTTEPTDCIVVALPSPAPTDQPSPPIPPPNRPYFQPPDSENQSPAPSHDQVILLNSDDEGADQRQPAPVECEETSGSAAGTVVTRVSQAIAGNPIITPDRRIDLTSVAAASPSLGGTTARSSSARQSPASMPELRPSRSQNSTPSAINPTHAPSSHAVSATGQPPASTHGSLTGQATAQATGQATAQATGQATAQPTGQARLQAPPRGPTNTNPGQPADQQAIHKNVLDCFRPDIMTIRLEQIIRDVGNIPDDSTTKPRIRLLKEAIHLCDNFYIVLHQILCVWSFSKDAAYTALGLEPTVAERGIGALQNAIRKNDTMDKTFIFQFANFPGAPNSGLWATDFYRKYLRQVAVCLHGLHEHWGRTVIPSMKPLTGRGYPILSDELRSQLRVCSPVLEPILFTVTRRHMGISDGPIAEKMTELFQIDAKTDYGRMSPGERNAWRDRLIARYKQLVLEHRELQPSPATAIQQPPQPTAIQQPPQPTAIQQPPQPAAIQQPPQPAAIQQPPPPTAIQQQQQQQQQPPPTQLPRPPAPPTQQMTNQTRRHSSGHPQATGPGLRAPILGFELYPSPSVQQPSSFPNNFAPPPPQFTLLGNNYVPNRGMQMFGQPNMARLPLASSHLNQPLTPAGSPLNTNVQLPHAGRMMQSPAQTSPVLQAPPGGLSVSMPVVSSPTQHSPQTGQGHPLSAGQPLYFPHNAGIQTPHISHPQLNYQQSIQAENMRQMNMQRQGQAMMSTHLPNMMSPHMHQMHQTPHTAPMPTHGNPQQLQQNFAELRHAASSSPRNSTARPRSARDVTPRLMGGLFRPPQQTISLDQMPHNPWEPKALTTALHQVDVRSPRRVPLELPLKDDPEPERHYQSIRNLAAGPIATEPCSELHRLDFTVSDEDFDNLCPNRLPIGEQIPVSQYFDGSIRYRLRLCELPVSEPEQKTVSESTWATGQAHWPDHISITINKQVMKIRRKQHNGQHQPVELTAYVVRGSNAVLVGITPPPNSRKRPNLKYFMAVEVIETLSHRRILDMVNQKGVRPAETTKSTIQNRLKPSQTDVDDEIAVTDEHLSIDLADPFSSTIFQIPVRGATCTHMECFDLANWLGTRPSKPKCTLHSGGDGCRRTCSAYDLGPEPSMVDKWKCPLCDGDARPYSLQMDSFMADVRDKLEKDGKLQTKTIYVAADGTWKPKEEEAGDEEEDEAATGTLPPAKRARTGPSPAEAAAVDIIELD
ncbi:miz zinc finger protein [Colletotrichum plurivorum]|uniref:Miz zinc finger protein n=1 Tax=Colletotrichum plurivorum TaxID=2175906 RepID=A0A8H6KY54_9PEZI|nr:miz zinc finger protein [Colletotrichum plurivorum]